MTQRITRYGLPAVVLLVALAAFAAGRRSARNAVLPPVTATAAHAEADHAHEGEACTEGDGCAEEGAAHADGDAHAHAEGDAHAHADGDAHAHADGVVHLNAAQMQASAIETGVVALAPVAASLALNGEVQADGDRTARVGSPVAGRLVALKARVGDRVRRGQVLAVVSSRDVAETQAALARARAEEQAARARLQNVRALAATGALTRRPLEEAQNAHTAALADVKRAEAALARAQSARDLAQADLARTRKLAAAGAFSARPVEEARGEVAEAQAELETAQAAVKARQAAFDRSQRLFSAGVAARREVESAEAELAQAKAQEREARTHLTVARQALAREEEVARQNLHTTGEVQAAEAALRQAEKEVEDRQAEVTRARGHLQVAAAVLARERKVAGQSLLARKEVQEAEAALARARADVQAAQNALQAIRAAGSARGAGAASIPVTSPINGIVTERTATLGQAIEASTDLFTVVGNESVWVWASVYEKDLPHVRPGQPARVSCPVHPGHEWNGQVGYVGVISDEKTRSTRVRIDLPNPNGVLRPGMFVSVALQLREKRQALAVPATAVQQMGEEYVVFVAGHDGEFTRRPVRVGARTGALVEVLGGVQQGERVATRNAFLLKSELMKDQLSEGCAH